MGARPTKAGASAIHTHMTNSWNTPVEVFEQVYPVRMRRYAVRRGSGGRGKHNGGDGIIREIEFLTDTQVGLLCDRRLRGPYGLAGGSDGAPGKTRSPVRTENRPLSLENLLSKRKLARS